MVVVTEASFVEVELVRAHQHRVDGVPQDRFGLGPAAMEPATDPADGFQIAGPDECSGGQLRRCTH